jgi:hypothetical protein
MRCSHTSTAQSVQWNRGVTGLGLHPSELWRAGFSSQTPNTACSISFFNKTEICRSETSALIKCLYRGAVFLQSHSETAVQCTLGDTYGLRGDLGTRRYGSEEAEPIDWIVPPGSISKGPGRFTNPGLSEMFAYHATTMANTIKTSLIVFSRKVGPCPSGH